MYRDAKLRRIDAFNHYAQYVARELLEIYQRPGSLSYDSGIDEVARALQLLSLFLNEFGITWNELNDKRLESFRDWLNERTKKDPRVRNDLSSQRTSNYRLRVIYAFCCWAQEEARLCENLIGKGKEYRIQSVIVEAKRAGKSFPDKRMHPKCFPSVGENSRISDDQYWATEEDADALTTWFRKNRGPDVAERNVLLMRLAQYTGWRRNALLSLTTDLFSLECIENAAANGETTLLIRPSTQKSGNAFKKPVSLLWCRMVNTYINGGRARIMKRLLLTGAQQCSAVFVNVSDGTPLTPAHISAEFGDAFRAVGAPLGAGLHSFKRLFGDNTADEVIASFKSRGIALTWENLAATMKSALDHRGDYSWECYVRAVKRVKGSSVEARLREQITDASAEAALLEARLEQLESQAVEMESDLRKQLEAAQQEARHWKETAQAPKKRDKTKLGS
ncbi:MULTISPECIES: hypothetical protein [unclassified Caballeronia]|uniref:hypothetical protein n=1 Tax=unclassified Caballeronia TaxID=2646786 RepID=UPI00285EF401|nr:MULTISPECIES: hypothetical protein [unclassified Caballeronia]MDR5751362.1 hypothetical protein [Caballeronia sp. LZ024]MDR5844496.1 hypothetical protein [Caballeronia sp. LZ031]